MRSIKVLIVDDSAVARQTFKALLESDPEIDAAWLVTQGQTYFRSVDTAKGLGLVVCVIGLFYSYIQT